ncbi:T9SS type A sorting domain-containing protein [Ulvibacter antarcticus]|uniref:Putative secreted protein (Por secretion system target) n=1 Tax=Ulvibacter antarcticus TaxID=442714 RepID=A0A3L9YF51_9FLAO|nr:T9SS type A sorting domain-containing protein [Ulvibacter antarcticus]RMA57739.1 putative secreted protein (Por secretion system target) [Ulvibacter antarcticus]
MKQKLLLLSVLFASFSMLAQSYTVVDGDGGAILDGHEVTYGVLTYPEASLDFFVTNTTSAEIYMRIELESAVNADGTGFELCFGECLSNLSIGQSVPAAPEFIAIPVGGTTPQGNHFYNSFAGNGSDVLEYNFRFYLSDAAGNDIGEELRLTYYYDPLLSLNDFEALDVNIFNTTITNELTVDVAEDVNLKVYDLQGRIVKNENLNAGRTSINMSDLSAQMYILQFDNNRGLSHTQKVVVK